MNRYVLQILQSNEKTYMYSTTANTAREAVEKFNRGILHRIDGDVVIGVFAPIDEEWEDE